MNANTTQQAVIAFITEYAAPSDASPESLPTFAALVAALVADGHAAAGADVELLEVACIEDEPYGALLLIDGIEFLASIDPEDQE